MIPWVPCPSADDSRSITRQVGILLLQTDFHDEGAHRVTSSVPDVHSTKGDTTPLRDEVRGKPPPVALALSRHSRLQIAISGRRGSPSGIDLSVAGTRPSLRVSRLVFFACACASPAFVLDWRFRHLVTSRRRFFQLGSIQSLILNQPLIFPFHFSINPSSSARSCVTVFYDFSFSAWRATSNP